MFLQNQIDQKLQNYATFSDSIEIGSFFSRTQNVLVIWKIKFTETQKGILETY